MKNLELTTNIKPAVNQIEINPWFQQTSEVTFAQSEDILVEAWAPFAEGKHNIFTNEKIKAIGEKYGKSNGQVILRWLLQRGITVIPKSVHKNRMEENIDVFDFELSPADMEVMASLDKNESQFFDHRDPVAIEQIFGSSLRQLHLEVFLNGYQLYDIIHQSTINHPSLKTGVVDLQVKNSENITTDIIVRVCDSLNCGINEIMELINDGNN